MIETDGIFWDPSEYSDLNFSAPTELRFIEANRINKGNPKYKDENGDLVYNFSSVKEIPNNYFLSPEYSILLPGLPQKIARFALCTTKPILLKKSTALRNTHLHKEIKNNKYVLYMALNYPIFVMFNKPQSRPSYRVVAHKGNYVHLATIDVDKGKKFTKIVDWRCISIEKFNRSVENANFNGCWTKVIL